MQHATWLQKCLSALRVPVYREEAVESETGLPVDLACIRQEMMRVMAPCSGEHQARAMAKLMRASSPMDLWLLRPDLYLYLAQDLGQAEAAQRMVVLLPLFAGWAPRPAAHGNPRDNAADGIGLH